MKFREFGNPKAPSIVLVHGGGLSWWAYQPMLEGLQDFHVILPVIDGHGEDGETTFVSIADSATKLTEFIDHELDGNVELLGGLSIGAQIAVQALTQRPNIARRALLESALMYPIAGIGFMSRMMYGMAYGLIKQRGFAKLQAKSLFIPEGMFESYFEDSLKISKQTLVNVSESNGNFVFHEESLRTCSAKVLIVAGEREPRIVKRSAQRLHEALANSKIYLAPKMGHGELSLAHPQEYLALVRDLLEK